MKEKVISIRKREKAYQYCFEAGKVKEKRKQITYDEFINGVTSFECNMLYGDYLDYLM